MTRARLKAEIERLKRRMERLIELRRRKAPGPPKEGRIPVKDGRKRGRGTGAS